MDPGRFRSPSDEARNDLPGQSPSRLICRQPILNGRREVAGYGILFSVGWESDFGPDPDDTVGRRLAESLCAGIGALAGSRLAFIKCTREAVVSELATVFPPKTTVLEIAAPAKPDDELVSACVHLRKMGYAFALDGLLPDAKMLPLLEIASYVKVDFYRSDPQTRREIKRFMRGTRAKLLGEKVEDHLEFAMARAEGFEFFQGEFFFRPKLVAGRPIPPNRMAYLRLLMQLARTPVDVDEVMRIVQSEASLCCKLLLLANSPLWALRSNVTSPKHALMLMGEGRFRTLVSAATSSVLSEHQPSALSSLSLQRARFCELLAPEVGEKPNEQFILGLLSLLDAMLETQIEPVIKTLSLRAEARAALLGSNDSAAAPNSAAAPLGLIRAFESADWESCAKMTSALGISEETLGRLYVESVEWAAKTLSVIR